MAAVVAVQREVAAVVIAVLDLAASADVTMAPGHSVATADWSMRKTLVVSSSLHYLDHIGNKLTMNKYFLNVLLVFKYLKHIYPIDRTYFISKAIISLFNSISPILMLFLPKLVIDELTEGGDFKKIIIYVSIMILFELFTYVFVQSLIGRQLDYRLSHINNYIGAEIAMKRAELDMSQVESPYIHDLAGQAQRVKNAGLAFQIVDQAINLVSSILMIITTSAMVIKAGWWILPVVIVFALASVFVSAIIEKRRFNNETDSMRLFRYENYFMNTFQDDQLCKEVRFFRLYKWLNEKHNSVFYSLMARERRMSGENMKILVPFQAAEIVKNYGVYLYLGWCTFVRKITIGEFTQYFQAVGSLSGSLISIFCFFKSFNENSRYINAYLEFMKIKPNIEGWDNAGIVSDNKYAASLVLKNVSFKYNDDNQCVLNNISFSFEMGKVYSLIGTNGAGKTTLLNLLCRLYDVTDGEILYNGVPIKQYNIDSYRALFSSVFQQTKTFALSIAENVALDKYRVGDQEQRKTIYAIFQRIGMGDFIDSLPDGIDTQMGKIFDENGVILSGGQMQKIAIARALFRDSEILLFAEPSSALDPIAEDEFFNVLRSVSGGKMVFYVSHRLSSAIFAHEILFIRDHKIFAHGPHFELLRTCLEYYEYYNAQAKYYQTEEQNHE